MSTPPPPRRSGVHPQEWPDVLPSAAVNLRLTEAQSLRISATRTLARPEYRELSPITSRDVIGGDNVQGDPGLERTRIWNEDVRWNGIQPPVKSSALRSLPLVRPADRARLSARRKRRTHGVLHQRRRRGQLRRRAGAAKGTGIPGELAAAGRCVHERHGDGKPDSPGETEASATNKNRRMVGQAPYVINAGMTHNIRGGSTSATVRCSTASASGSTPWATSRCPTVAAALRCRLRSASRSTLPSAAASTRRTCSTTSTTIQGTVVREAGRAGCVLQLGLTFRP